MGPGKGNFRRRVEPLDWRKIASLDIEKILEDTDGTALKEILPQITYCQAELEFDHEKTDPGFRKVFQLSQLIIQYLLDNQEVSVEKAATSELKYQALVLEADRQAEELKTLTDKLVQAKRELKKRKEVLASNQTELLGRNNNDEFDKCPYCTKKFMSSVYLYSHLHRRHQGLPPRPLIPQNEIVRHLQMGILSESGKPSTNSVTLATQTEPEEKKTAPASPPAPVQLPINIQTVSELVETYLAQKAEENRDKLLSPKSGPSSSLEIRRKSIEETEKHIASMKTDLENQWRNLAQKIENSGIQELTGTLVGEMHKMQDLIANNSSKNAGDTVLFTSNKHQHIAAPFSSESASISTGYVDDAGDTGCPKREEKLESLREDLQSKDLLPNSNGTGEPALKTSNKHQTFAVPFPSESSSISHVSNINAGDGDDGCQKHAQELESLKEDLQSKSHEDLTTIESKLESQERFWRSRLRMVEEEYIQQIAGLREEMNVKLTLTQQQIFQHQQQLVAPVKAGAISEIRRELQLPSELTPPLPVSIPNQTQPPPIVVTVTQVAPGTNDIIPVPKPRSTVLPQTELLNSAASVTEKEGSTMYPDHHEYEEPQDHHHINSEDALDYSVSEPSLSDAELEHRKKKAKQEKVRQEQMSPTAAVRKRVVNDVDQKMEQLGIRPNVTELLKEDMVKVLGRLKHERHSIEQENFAREREIVKMEAQTAALERSLEGKVETPRRKHSAPPLPSTSTSPKEKLNVTLPKSPNTSKSPIVRMFRALQNYDIKEKLTFFRKKPKRSRLLIPSTSPKKIQKKSAKSFFRRRNKKGEMESKGTRHVESPDEDSSEDEEGSSTSSTSPNSILVKDRKRRVSSRASRQAVLQIKENPVSKVFNADVSDTDLETDNDGGGKGDASHRANASDTSSWRCSELQKNAKEAIKKSTIPIIPQVSLVNTSRRSSLQKPYVSTHSESDGESSELVNSRSISKDPSPRSHRASSSDSETVDKPSTVIPAKGADDQLKGQYVTLKAPEPKVILYNKPEQNMNEFGFQMSNMYADVDEPDFYTSTPIRNPPESHRPATASQPRPETLSPIANQYESLERRPVPAEQSTSLSSDWGHDSETDFQRKPDFVIPNPKNAPQSILKTPSPKRPVAGSSPFSPGKAPVTSPTSPRNLNLTAPQVKKAQQLQPWSVSAHRPPTAVSRNTKYTANGSPRKLHWN